MHMVVVGLALLCFQFIQPSGFTPGRIRDLVVKIHATITPRPAAAVTKNSPAGERLRGGDRRQRILTMPMSFATRAKSTCNRTNLPAHSAARGSDHPALDLATLKLDDESFFEGAARFLSPLICPGKDIVNVYGYPTGGPNSRDPGNRFPHRIH